MKHFLVIMLLTSAVSIKAQLLYNPAADAEKDIKAAVLKAKNEKKFVLLQAGGNWCSWCIRFANFVKDDSQVDSAMNAGFVWYHLNYSKENTNDRIMAQYGFPQRFGFPVFIILDENGNRIHTQSSEYLEDGGKSYDKEKVIGFLNMWSPPALDPASYKKKK